MTARKRTIEVAIALLLAPLMSQPAFAAEQRCPVTVEVPASGGGADWRAAADELRAELARASTCARGKLQIAWSASHATLTFVPEGGAAAVRVARSPRDLLPLALGLVTTVPEEASPETPPSAMPGATANPPAPAPSTAPEAADLPPPDTRPIAASRPRDPSFLISIGAGSRVGEPTGVVFGDAALHADAVIARSWLVGLSARVGAFGARPGAAAIASYQYEELAFGVELGRRMMFGGALDLLATAAVVVVDEEGGVSGEPGDSASGGVTYARVGVLARWLPVRVGAFRFGATLETDCAPFDLRAAPTTDVGLPVLPTWSIGARLTASGEIR